MSIKKTYTRINPKLSTVSKYFPPWGFLVYLSLHILLEWIIVTGKKVRSKSKVANSYCGDATNPLVSRSAVKSMLLIFFRSVPPMRPARLVTHLWRYLDPK
jgi:hypothetical protein